MGSHKEEFLKSEDLTNYIDEIKKEERDVKGFDNSCKKRFAKEHHQKRPSWWTGRIVVALASLLFRLPAACMKRSLLENVRSGKYMLTIFYLL